MKWLWWALGGLVAIILGVVMAFRVELAPAPATSLDSPRIREVLLGIPTQQPTVETPWQGSDHLTQKRHYTTMDLLALRVVSDAPAERQLKLTARLLLEDGSVESLSPATITVPGGMGGYCCWTVAKEGEYKLQIFRENESSFVVPLTIVKSTKQAPKAFF
jgi:hypothetical protein